MRPIIGRLTVATLAKSGKRWLQGGLTTVDHVVAYYRDLWELSPYRVRQLKRLLAE